MNNQKTILKIFEAISKNKSGLIIGSAGTGKSTLIIKIANDIESKYGNKSVGVCAMTGIAAVRINAQTLHSLLGIGITTKSDEMVKKINARLFGKKKKMINLSLYNKKKRMNIIDDNSDIWETMKYLIIDEVSMMSGDFFDNLEETARRVKHNDLFFGGINLILVGDFFQLPPVSKDNISEKYLFESEIFKKNFSKENIFELTDIYRQTDQLLISILNEIKFSKLSENSIKILKQCERELDDKDGIKPTIFFSLNKDVDKYNENKLNELKGDTINYISDDEKDGRQIKEGNKIDECNIKKLNNLMLPKCLKLKKGAQVMYLTNSPRLKLYNGSRGVVTKVVSGGLPTVKFQNGVETTIFPIIQTLTIKLKNKREIKLTRENIPLKLAWALTIHKSQGSTVEKALIDGKNIFENGQFYVAISRVKELKGLQLRNFDPKRIKTDERVLLFYSSLK